MYHRWQMGVATECFYLRTWRHSICIEQYIPFGVRMFEVHTALLTGARAKTSLQVIWARLVYGMGEMWKNTKTPVKAKQRLYKGGDNKWSRYLPKFIYVRKHVYIIQLPMTTSPQIDWRAISYNKLFFLKPGLFRKVEILASKVTRNEDLIRPLDLRIEQHCLPQFQPCRPSEKMPSTEITTYYRLNRCQGAPVYSPSREDVSWVVQRSQNAREPTHDTEISRKHNIGKYQASDDWKHNRQEKGV